MSEDGFAEHVLYEMAIAAPKGRDAVKLAIVRALKTYLSLSAKALAANFAGGLRGTIGE